MLKIAWIDECIQFTRSNPALFIYLSIIILKEILYIPFIFNYILLKSFYIYIIQN